MMTCGERMSIHVCSPRSNHGNGQSAQSFIYFYDSPRNLHDFRLFVQVKQDDIFMISAVARLGEY